MYFIIFGVTGAHSEEIGLQGTYTDKSKAWVAAYACRRTIPEVESFMIYPLPKKTKKQLVHEIMPLYQLAYPNEDRLGDVYDALYSASEDYLVDMLATLMITEVA